MKRVLISSFTVTISLLVQCVVCDNNDSLSLSTTTNDESTSPSHGNLRTTTRGLYDTLGAPVIGEIHAPGSETTYSACVPEAPANTLGMAAYMFLTDEYCSSNDDCSNGSGCCVKAHCKCQKPGSLSVWSCMDDTREGFPPVPEGPGFGPPVHKPDPPATGNLVVAWHQCTKDDVCDQPNGYKTEKSCEGDDDCEGADNYCEILCAGMDWFCHDKNSKLCKKKACDSVGCGANEECVSEFSNQCGPKVCKNTTEPILQKSCSDVSCTDAADCVNAMPPGSYACVPKWNIKECGVA